MAAKLTLKFQELQEERTRTFHELDSAHKAFLSHCPNYEEAFDDFKKSVSQATAKFKKISEDIIEIRKILETAYPSTGLGPLVAKIQDLEEKKLQIVVDHQLAKQQALDNPEDELCERNARLIKQGLDKLCLEINETLTSVRYQLAELED